jgi:group I intron endonuclease
MIPVRLIVYLVESPNGKRYVGITSKSLRTRWIQHLSEAKTGSKMLIHKAIRKYEPKAFKVSELACGLSWDYLCELEQLFIRELGTFGRNGYNQTIGGEGTLGWRPSEEVRAKMSARMKLYRHSEESKRKIGEANAKRVWKEESRRKRGEANARRVVSAETRAKMSAHRKGKARVSADRGIEAEDRQCQSR